MKKSKKNSLNWRDILKGLGVAMASAVITAIPNIINNTLSIKDLAGIAIIAACGYLSVTFFEDEKGSFANTNN